MVDYYDKLFKLCGYEEEELNNDRERIEEVLRRVDLRPEDMPAAESWLKENHDVSLSGVRMALRIWLKELVDMVLAKDEGKKLLFYGFPTIPGPAAAIASSTEEIVCMCPDAILAYTTGNIFHKTVPIIESGEMNGLPPGHSLCSLQQTRVGGLARGIIPVPDLVLTSSYYCDMGSKTDELLHERYGHPAIYIDGSMDSGWGEFPDYDRERIKFLGGEINNALDRVEDILGIKVTEKARIEGALRNREVFKALNKLIRLMRDADPQPVSMVEVDMMRRISHASGSRRVITELPDAINVLIKEIEERMDRGIGIVKKGAPRIATIFLSYSDPGITHMIENQGLAIPVSLLDLVNEKHKKSPSAIEGEALAEAEMEAGIFYGNCGFIFRATEALKDSNLDGFIWNYLYNCRPLTQMSHLLVQYAEKETDIPILSLESDLVDSRTYGSEAMKTRVETFAEMLKARKASLKS